VRGGRNTGLRLNARDWQAIKLLPTVTDSCPIVTGSASLVYNSFNWNTSYTGTTGSFLTIRGWSVAQGRFFTGAETVSCANLAVLGKTVANKLFGATDPLDKMIRVGNQPFRVIGVMEEKGEASWGASKDDSFLLPYTTAQRKLKGNQQIDGISAVAKTAEQVKALEEQIIITLKARYNCRLDDKDAFYAKNQAEEMKTADESTRVFTILLGGIASVSLLVGGIGIMNIMLVSVTERVREIGIRMALGARSRDILLQFLVESVLLSLLGGALGIALGAYTSVTIASMADWPAVISESSVILSFGFAAAIGVFFGFYPALQASKLDPIQALRSE